MLATVAFSEPRKHASKNGTQTAGCSDVAGIAVRVATKRQQAPDGSLGGGDPRDVQVYGEGSQGLSTPPNNDAPPPYGLHLVTEEGISDADGPDMTNGTTAPKTKPDDKPTSSQSGTLWAPIVVVSRSVFSLFRAGVFQPSEDTSRWSRFWSQRVQHAKAAVRDFMPEPVQVASVVPPAVCVYGHRLPTVSRLLIIGASEIFCNLYDSALRHFNFEPCPETPEAKIERVIQLSLEHQERERRRSYPKTNVMIVTGANSGIGYEIAKAALKASYYVILACRSEYKALDAMRRLETETGSHRIEFMRLDLSDLQSVEAFAAEILDRSLLCNVLVNNAGIMDVPFRKATCGVESQMAVNHLGHFLLTNLLINNITHAGGRVVNVSSGAHFGATDIEYDRLDGNEKYSRLGNYAMSKLANVMFTISLASKVASHNVIVNACHPGAVSTNLYSNNHVNSLLVKAVDLFLQPDTLFRSPVHGAVTPITLALHPSATFTGQYVCDERIWRPNPAALDAAKCEALWRWSEERTTHEFRIV